MESVLVVMSPSLFYSLGHFLADAAPFLFFSLDVVPARPAVVVGAEAAFVREVLSWAPVQVVPLGANCYVTARRAFALAERTWWSHMPGPLQELRRAGWKAAGASRGRPKRCVAMNRRPGLHRHVTNWPELVAALAHRSGREWSAQRTVEGPIAPKVREFAAVLAYVAPEGSACSWLLFMQEGTVFCQIDSCWTGQWWMWWGATRCLGQFFAGARIGYLEHADWSRCAAGRREGPMAAAIIRGVVNATVDLLAAAQAEIGLAA